MKIIITENRLEKVLKQSGVEKTVKLLGGWENFRKVFNINSYEDYLHLFDDLDIKQSIEIPKYRLYKYNDGQNIIIYNTIDDRVGINDGEILSVLVNDLLGLKPVVKDSRVIIQKWLSDIYNIDVEIRRIHRMYSWDSIAHIK
jgi:hypothetical protein